MVEYLIQFKNYLDLAGMSPRTIKVYSQLLVGFLKTITDPKVVTTKDLVNFALSKKSNSARKQMQGVFKHFYTGVIPRKQILTRLPRIKQKKYLPVILTETEAQKVLHGLRNIKHRAMLHLLYYGGLRVSEVINLKIENINGVYNTIHIQNSKGAKDRIVPIPLETVELLREYYKKEKPKTYLFNTYKKGEKYSTKSLQKIVLKAVDLQNIHKHITPHSLRHSRATHLLNNGVDIKIIKEFLGHARLRTTEMYLHLTKIQMQQHIVKADEKIRTLYAA